MSPHMNTCSKQHQTFSTCKSLVVLPMPTLLHSEPSMTWPLSYDNSTKGYKLWNPQKHSIITSTDVVFEESIFPFKTPKPSQLTPKSPAALNPLPANLVLPDSDDEDEGVPPPPVPEPPPPAPVLLAPLLPLVPGPEPGPLQHAYHLPSSLQLYHLTTYAACTASWHANHCLTHQMQALTKSSNGYLLLLFSTSVSTYLAVVQVTPTGDPNTYKYVLSTPDTPHW